MFYAWVLLLSVTPPKPEVYVYVENDPHQESQHVIDALQTPIDSLYSRHPTNETHKYVSWLHCARHDLMESATVYLRTRDRYRVSSEIRLPAWSFSPREVPVPLYREAYRTWPGVCEYLRYVAKLRPRAISKLDYYWFFGFKTPAGAKWLTPSHTEILSQETINGSRVDVRTIIDKCHYKVIPPFFVPVKELPYKTIIEKTWEEGDYHHKTTEITEYRTTKEDLIEMMMDGDLDTGIIEASIQESLLKK